MKNKRQMQKFYFSTLYFVCSVAGRINEEKQLHEELKVGRGRGSTASMSSEHYFEYIEFCFELFDHVHNIHFDSDAYMGEGLSFVYEGEQFYFI